MLQSCRSTDGAKRPDRNGTAERTTRLKKPSQVVTRRSPPNQMRAAARLPLLALTSAPASAASLTGAASGGDRRRLRSPGWAPSACMPWGTRPAGPASHRAGRFLHVSHAKPAQPLGQLWERRKAARAPSALPASRALLRAAAFHATGSRRRGRREFPYRVIWKLSATGPSRRDACVAPRRGGVTSPRYGVAPLHPDRRNPSSGLAQRLWQG